MKDIMSFEAGTKFVALRLRQGLKPLIRIEVKRWKGYHTVSIMAREDVGAAWADVMMTMKPFENQHGRQWDITARLMWEHMLLVGGTSRYAYLTQLLSHLMFTYEVEVYEVARKRDLIQ